jgi:transcriptional regulator with XRE-family HTH domain
MGGLLKMETYYKKRRRKMGLAPSDMAKELGINCKKYSLIENGVVKMPKNLIDKFNEIVNRGKNAHTLAKMTNEKLVTDFWDNMKSKTNGKYNLKEKMKEFNIETFKELGDLIGVSNSNISHYLNADWKAPYDFMNKVYQFFDDELNIQAPKKETIVKPAAKKETIKKEKSVVGRACKNEELINWYKNIDFRSILNEHNMTYDYVAQKTGVGLSSVSRAMRKSTAMPAYNTLKKLKEFFDSFEKDTIVVDEWINQPCETVDFDEFVMPELEKCDESPVEPTEKCDSEDEVIKRYHTEIEENNAIIETYQDIIDRLVIRNKVCEEVLKVIDELRGE